MDTLDDVDIDDDVDTELEVDTLNGIKTCYVRKKNVPKRKARDNQRKQFSYNYQ